MLTALSVPPADCPDGTGQRTIANRFLVAAVAISLAAVALLMIVAQLTIAWFRPGALAFLVAFAVLACVRWRYRNASTGGARIARDAAEYVGLSTAISLVGAVASYPVAGFSHGFADDWLQRCDMALHFDWLAWYRVTAAHPLLQHVSRASYALIYLSPAVLLGYFAISGRRREAYDFMAAVWLSAVITLFGFWFMPAIGPFAFLWHKPIVYLPVSDLWQPDLIPHLRDHSMRSVDLGHLVGLVSAPSFHAAAAVLIIVFATRHAAVRTPLILANIAMLLSTPVEGTHYLIDLILGAGVALVAIAIIAMSNRAVSNRTVRSVR